MLWNRRGSWILAALVALAWAPAALATTVVPVADADLVSTATAIVLADVKAIESRWDPATRRIFTVITLDVCDSLKGEIPLGPLTIRQLGGHVAGMQARSEEHTSELQSLRHLVCRLLLEKKKHHIYTQCSD